MQQSLIGFLRHLGAAMQVRDAFSHRAPAQVLLRPSLFGPVYPKVPYVVKGGFRSAEHAAELAIRFVVELGGVAVHAVLHTLAWLTTFQIRFQRPVKAGRNVSGLIHPPAEIAHHVGAGIAEHAMPHQQRHEPPQKVRLGEYHIGGPFRLVTRPVIIDRIILEETFVQRIQLPGEAVQQIGPVDLQLPVHQFLSLGVILDPDEAVALLAVLQAFPIHLTSQPFPSIQADLNVEGEPGLDARIHPSHLRMDLVLVDDLAWFQAAHDVSAPVFERRADFHTAECAYQTAFHFPLGGNGARDLLLVRRGIAQKPDGQSLILKRFDARLFYLLAYTLHVVQVILEQDAIRTEILRSEEHHEGLQTLVPAAVVQAPQRTPKHQAVESAQRSLNLVSIFVRKMLHGVLLSHFGFRLSTNTIRQNGERRLLPWSGPSERTRGPQR